MAEKKKVGGRTIIRGKKNGDSGNGRGRNARKASELLGAKPRKTMIQGLEEVTCLSNM